MTYRTGNHQPQNVYRDQQYIGVMFTAEDAALVVEALNGRAATPCALKRGPAPVDGCPCVNCTLARPVDPDDSCTCPFLSGVDPACPVHQGRKARGPKPPPLGPGCICDGSGRTCPRHGVVL